MVKNQKIFAIGDIHGRFEALKQCLKHCKFNYEKDKLILLGDIVDGGYNTYEVVEELLKIKNLIFVFGNHDEWFMNHIKNGWAEEIWIQQGGANTLRSYGAIVKESDKVSDTSLINTTNINIPVTHQEFFNTAKYYHLENNMLFVHGGFDIKKGLQNTPKHVLLWDRDLIKYVKINSALIESFDKVFIGHTTTQLIMNDQKFTKPIKLSNLWCLDTGAGWNGKLTIMNINTEQYWQSDLQIPAIQQYNNDTK